jgi:hypothetical protein
MNDSRWNQERKIQPTPAGGLNNNRSEIKYIKQKRQRKPGRHILNMRSSPREKRDEAAPRSDQEKRKNWWERKAETKRQDDWKDEECILLLFNKSYNIISMIDI